MGVHHFFASPDDFGDELVVLSGAEARHASRVLRVQTGERITVADNSGRVVDAIVTTTGQRVEARITATRNVPLPRPAITIHQALMKGDRMDDMIERSI